MPAVNDAFKRALALHQAGQLAEARVLYSEVLAADSGHFDSRHLLGLALVQAGEHEAGIAQIRQALTVRRDFPEAHYNLGNALLTVGRAEEALAALNAALSLKPGDAQYHLEAGNALKELGRLDEALAAYDRALALNPRSAEAWNNRGIALKDADRHDAALASYDRALSLAPRYAEAHSNRGNALRELHRFDEALASHDTAIALKPNHAEAHFNRGNVLVDMRRHEEALASFDAALRLRPQYAEAQHNKALLLLGRGHFAEGFAIYPVRWNTAAFTSAPLRTSLPRWQGEPEGHVLLWSEQGIGDEIFFASMLSLIPRGVTVTLRADDRLVPIYERSFPGIRIIATSSLAEPVDQGFTTQAPVGDLGTILKVEAGMLGSRRMPYLRVGTSRRQAVAAANPWLRRAPVCGLSWKSANRKFGAEKSLRLRDLAPLLSIPGLNFANLQYGEVEGEIADVRKELGVEVHCASSLDIYNDIDGLLALIDSCDIIVTTSNLNAHLAGALGKKAAVLVSRGKGCLWYWQGGANNLWYPGLQRIAQDSYGDWKAAVAAASTWVKDSI